MATKIKLMRLGKMRAPYYRIVVADARTKRDGRSIETIGKYHPKDNPSFIEVDAERAAYWLGVGAQPTEAVQKILSKTGDWQKFKGEPAPEPLQVAAPKADKRAAFEAAAQESLVADGATTPKKKAAPKKAAEPTAEAAEPAVETSEPSGDTTDTPAEADDTAADEDTAEDTTEAPAAEVAPVEAAARTDEAAADADKPESE
ncbi:MAG: rpsP [Frankiales bacterium]|nr:rpsP [Frankiales bacterium]